MRLASIKLAGFKSFVDPATLTLPTNLTGVVGPNGCGKSNIIDAIRWVMGESAASRLRGDAMTDVIFNGSSERKPVGQASVELIFDNSEQSIIGEYAAYSEISVRRLVTRDSQSQYFLNHQRCRRRDITDLFLGTGLGARSYSIIEQGMISQIVESAPEDLRVHLEEAAGISKYKDRRKETESRMRATRENLERLNDVREEVEKQLEHLERQAKQAERYSELKGEQRRKDGELKSLQWRRLDRERNAHEESLRQSELELEQLATQATELIALSETLRSQHYELGEHFAERQQQAFSVSAEIARIEQDLRYRHETLARLNDELAQSRGQIAQLGDQHGFDHEQLEFLSQQLALDQPRHEALIEAMAQAQQTLEQAELHWQQAQRKLSEQNEAAAKAARAADVERTRIDLTERQIIDALARQDGLLAESGQIDTGTLSEQFQELEMRLAQAQSDLAQANELLDQFKQSQIELEQVGSAIEQRKLHSEREISSGRARLSSLEALQHAALGQDKTVLNSWLRERGLHEQQRLGQVLVVDEGFEGLVERVLDELLETLLVAQSEALCDSAQRPPLPLNAADYRTPVRGPVGTLAEKVYGPRAVLDWLKGIRLAADIDAALSLRDSLLSGESWLCPDGTWLGLDWLRLPGRQRAHDGVLARTREIEAQHLQLEAAENALARVKQEVEQHALKRQYQLRERDEVQNLAYAQHRKVSELAGQTHAMRGKLEGAKTRSERIRVELAQIELRMREQHDLVRQARAHVAQSLDQLESIDGLRGESEQELARWKAQVEQGRARAREAQAQAHQLALSLEQRRTARSSLSAAIQRISQQQQQLSQRLASLEQRKLDTQTPITPLKAELQLNLDQKVLKERELNEARRALDECAQKLMKLDAERARGEQAENRLREKRTQEQLAAQGLAIRAETLAQQIVALECALAEVLAQLDASGQGEGQDLSARQQELVELEAKIKRLEPVNLAAIKELDETRQRKAYQDAQMADLNQALEILDAAIRKIDRETRSRFKDTFDQVNEGIKELFPKLFGGGHAALELTGDDLLTTGVNIIARPPGKRPSSIALLSGGEKALTAVALVFAIFRLNPAPFCLLDEVDAPLDEANVGRFCSMVREMSQSVQFLFVTHNKLTMEMAQQLAGVTMREAGVSRLVSVDLAEAAKLVT